MRDFEPDGGENDEALLSTSDDDHGQGDENCQTASRQQAGSNQQRANEKLDYSIGGPTRDQSDDKQQQQQQQQGKGNKAEPLKRARPSQEGEEEGDGVRNTNTPDLSSLGNGRQSSPVGSLKRARLEQPELREDESVISVS